MRINRSLRTTIVSIGLTVTCSVQLYYSLSVPLSPSQPAADHSCVSDGDYSLTLPLSPCRPAADQTCVSDGDYSLSLPLSPSQPAADQTCVSDGDYSLSHYHSHSAGRQVSFSLFTLAPIHDGINFYLCRYLSCLFCCTHCPRFPACNLILSSWEYQSRTFS